MSTDSTEPGELSASRNFIQQIVDADLSDGKNTGRVHTRFPPEPNGYLHIGHAKSICLNYGLADEYGGKFNLRFDDTNPTKEEQEFVDSIIEDVRWLGADWEDRLYFASDYFDQLYQWAEKLIHQGQAFVCDLSADEMREHRGTLTEPGCNSPCRDRTTAENLDLFRRMKAGEFAEGERTLRAKIDMSASNINLRDPVLYRIKHAHHHRTGDKWCIYPSYDFTHGQSDSIEGITHSICTLEFENHRPLYDWLCDALAIHHPRQIEFARLNLTYAVMSKRKLLQLVNEGHVTGWDDPRMLTLCGLRRRGYTPAAIRALCARIGVAKVNSTIDMAWLEDAVRNDLNEHAPRVMAVLHPLKVTIENYPADTVEQLTAANHPQKPEFGVREVPFSREIYVEREDFMEDAPRKFFRLSVGREVRLRYAYFITCTDVVKDDAGNVVELRCTYDPALPREAMLPTVAKSKEPSIGYRHPTQPMSKCGSTTTCFAPKHPNNVPREVCSSTTSIPTRSLAYPLPRASRHWPRSPRQLTSNLKEMATSSPTRSTHNRASPSSTGRQPCATRGRKWHVKAEAATGRPARPAAAVPQIGSCRLLKQVP